MQWNNYLMHSCSMSPGQQHFFSSTDLTMQIHTSAPSLFLVSIVSLATLRNKQTNKKQTNKQRTKDEIPVCIIKNWLAV